jgi:two-component sensor histidine kinase
VYHSLVNTDFTQLGQAVTERAADDPVTSNVINALAGQRTSPERELLVRLQQQELVAAFGLFALRAPTLEQVFDQSCQIAARGLDTGFAKVLAFRADTQDFLLCSGVGWNPGVVGHARVGADLASPAGFALRTKMPVVSNHLTAESRFRTPSVLAEHGIHRAINVIISEEGGLPFGVLEADSSDRLQFTTHDIAFMQALANVVAAAIERHRQIDSQNALLREKDILMQEVHHRIKNSLQLVQTMLQLQARSVTEDGERARLNDAAARILSIAAVHERLYEEGAIEQVAVGSYLTGLLTNICMSIGDTPPHSVDVEPMLLPPEHVTQIGLIAVELVTNALKYGAPPIRVSVRRTEAGVEIVVRDSGAGFAAGYESRAASSTPSSLGMRLIAAMARTPNAVTIDRSEPTTSVRVLVTFSAPRRGL